METANKQCKKRDADRGGNQPIDAMLFLEFKFGYIIALCT